MKLNKLLARQIKKFLPEDCLENEELKSFLNAVNDSYNAHERDSELSEHAFRMSEEEYLQLNEKLLFEIKLKEDSIDELRQAVLEIGENTLLDSSDGNDLLQIASYLKKQISLLNEKDKKLHDQQEFYERILNVIPADIVIVDKARKYRFVNPNAIKNPELRAWIIGKTDDEYAAYTNKPEKLINERRSYFESAVSTRARTEWEETIVMADGQTEHHLRMLYPVFDELGEFDMMVVYGIDITERKKINEQIRISEERYRSIFNNSQALICTHTLDGIILDANIASTEILGYGIDNLIGISLSQLLPAEKREEFETGYLAELKQHGKASGIMVALDKEGKKIYLLYKNYLVAKDTEEPYVIGISQDITARIEAEQALKKSETKYRSIIANMHLGLLEVDEDERIIYANNSFCEMSGYELDELIGRNASDVFLKEGATVDIGEKTEMRRQGVADAYEMRTENKAGELKWWLVSGAPSFDDNGRFVGSIGIHLDITLQKDLEQALRKAKADVERSAQSKDIFLANISHEIRTPMNAILGIENLLNKTTLDDKQRHYLSIIQNATSNLLVILNDLLDFSKIEAGKIAFENVGFELGKIIDDAIVILKYKAAEKSLFIGNVYSPDISPVLIGDPYRISQVLMNLLSNSIKFTERGTVSIECSVVAEDDISQYVQFTIEDTGIGMSEEFIDRLFNKFAQEDDSITRKFGGTGLGMSICKELVELMGGSINVESIKDEGTTISFVLGLVKGTIEDLPAKSEFDIDKQIFKGKRILLVEDNEANRLIANTIFTSHGAEVVEAENGDIAIRKIQESTYDVVLMDVRMPVKDGLEATRFIRANIDKNIPIIALTASALKEEEDRCIQSGMTDFVSKPFNENWIVQVVARWLGKEIKVVVPADEDAANAGQLFSLNKIETLGRGNTEFVKEMMDLFVQHTPETLDEMEEAINNNDWKRIANLAHFMKPSIRNLAVSSIFNDLEELENIIAAPADIDQVWVLFDRVRSVLGEVTAQLKTILKGCETKTTDTKNK